MSTITELSKNTLKSYMKKADKSYQVADKKIDREEDKAMSTDGNKYPEKQARHVANATSATKTLKKRIAGRKMATKKLAKEDIESLMTSAKEKNALVFEEVFNKLLTEAVSEAVELYKQELAKTLFSEAKSENDNEDETEDDNEGSEEVDESTNK